MKLAVEIFDAVITNTCGTPRDRLVQLVGPPAAKTAALSGGQLIQVLLGFFGGDVCIDPTG